LTVGEAVETLHTEGTCESRADANVRRGWSFGRVSLAFDLGKIRRRQTLSGDQVEALHGPRDRDIEQPPFLSLRIPSAHAHGLQYVRVLDLRRETEQVIAGVGDDDDVGLQSLRLMRRQDANSLHVPIRVGHGDSIPSAGFDDVLEQVIRSA